MKLLLTGVLPWSVWSIARRLTQGGHEVTLVGAAPDSPGGISGVRHVKLNPGERDTTRFITAGGYDSILFFFASQCEDSREYGAVQGRQLDAMFDILHGATHTGLRQFILITDQRVFGQGQEAREDEEPVPDTPTGVMIRAAESCVTCGVPEEIRTLIVRTTSLYAENDPTDFFGQARRCAESGVELVMNGSADTPCDFLHAEDFGVLLEYAVSMELTGVLHAPQGRPSTYGETADLLKSRLPSLSVSFLSEGRRCRAVLNGSTASSLGWVPRHDFRREMEELTAPEKKEAAAVRKKKKSDGILWEILKWVEVAGLAFIAVWLTRLGENSAALSSVDYMLLYVILMGFIHGRGAGVTAAVLMCAWYCVSFVSKGNSAADLLYNTDHWLPMSVYLLSGALFGYAQDRRRLKVETLKEEKEEIGHERDFMEGIYQQTYEDRNQLKEQIYHSRDSYGRIYQITRELDTLQPVQVFLSTLHVLESTLQNNNVAIYECKPETSYIRLVVRSREMRQLPRSLNLKEYPEMQEALMDGKLFANRNLLTGYPVYALPVRSGNEVLAVLMLWSVPFERQSMYMENLLSVVAGLVQSALIRAMQYHDQVADLYYPDTHILTSEAFRSALGVYETIRQRRMGEHVLVRLHTEREMAMEIVDRYIGKLVRSTDLVGRLDDGAYYVLFPQANTDRMPAIEARMSGSGIRCEVISEDVAIG